MSKLRDKKWKKRGSSNKGQNGITLIALVITVIVLLILAGISIATLTGDNGILKRTTEAKELTEVSSEKESISLAVIEIKMNTENVNASNLQEAMNNQVGKGKTVITDNEDGTFIVSFINSKRNYYVNTENGNIEEVEEGTDIYVAFYASDKTLRFASKKDTLPSIDETNGDKDYGNIKWKVFMSSTIEDTEGNNITVANVPWSEEIEKVTKVEILDELVPTNTSFWFANCTNLTSINLEKLDTSKVTDMQHMFYRCKSLSSLDINNFVTTNVTSMFAMFDQCGSLINLDLSSFDTSNVTNMRSMFLECCALTSLDLSGFDTSKVTTMYSMFGGCSALTSLDLSSFDTNEVTSMYGMFNKCTSLSSLDINNFVTTNVTNMFAMFNQCSSLINLDLSSFDTSNVTNMRSMFNGCSALTSLDLSSFDTSKVTTMYSMFGGCSALTSLDLSSFDTSNVTSMYGMFYKCSSLSIDCSKWNVQNVTEHTNFNMNASNVIAPTWMS